MKSLNLDKLPPEHVGAIRAACHQLVAIAAQDPTATGATLALPGEKPRFISVREACQVVRAMQCGRRA